MDERPYNTISNAKNLKNHTARSKLKSELAPADCVQMSGAAKIKLTTDITPMSMTTRESRLDA